MKNLSTKHNPLYHKTAKVFNESKNCQRKRKGSSLLQEIVIRRFIKNYQINIMRNMTRCDGKYERKMYHQIK